VSPPLKPCPFCGGAPAFLEDNNHSTAWSVECLSDGCLLNPSVWGATAKAAVTAWNTRALEREAKAEPVARKTFTLNAEESARFVDAINDPPPPTQALIDLMAKASPPQDSPASQVRDIFALWSWRKKP
jgi:hypothetical protein